MDNPIRKAIARALRGAREVARSHGEASNVALRNRCVRATASHALQRVGIKWEYDPNHGTISNY